MKFRAIFDFLNKINIQYDFKGDQNLFVKGYSSLKNYKKDTFTWSKNELAYQYDFSNVLLVIAQEGLNISAQNVIYTNESKRAFFSLIDYFAEQENISNEKEREMIGKGTVIGPFVKIGTNVKIGSNCVLDGKISIGDNSIIWNNVVIINNVAIGSDCEVQSGCVIGHDGFAWVENEKHQNEMIKHYGGIEIGNRVFIGPNCVIDRGEIDNTVIGNGSKIDANCFIAHNVRIGENAILITGTKLYGSSEIGDNAYLASAIVRNQCKIGSHTMVGMGAVVTKSIEANKIVAGVPAKEINK